MQELSLKASARVPKQPTAGVRGIVYGKDQKTQTIEADQLTLERLYHEAGHNRVIDLIVGDGTPLKVMFQEVQHHPVNRHIIHFDLHAVSLKEKMRAAVPVHLEGDSPAVMSHEGTLTTVTDTIEVEAEPLSLPENFTIDISELREVNDHITVGDLRVGEGVEIITEPEILIVKIDPIVEEVEEEPVEEEGEEGAEGEGAAEGEETEAGEDTTEGAEGETSDKPSGESKSEE